MFLDFHLDKNEKKIPPTQYTVIPVPFTEFYEQLVLSDVGGVQYYTQTG